MLQESLLELLRDQRAQLDYLRSQPREKFEGRPAEREWSAAECLAHLNVYARMYLPALERALVQSPKSSKESYSPGWLGAYVAEAMRPLPHGKKMKTFRSTDPHYISYSADVAEEFEKHLQAFISLLEGAFDRNLEKRRVAMVKLPFLRFQLGDMLQILINHQSRHLDQAIKAIGAKVSLA